MDTTIRVGVMFLTMTLAGCASHGNLVRCDGRLEPINVPMPREERVAPDTETESARLHRE